MHTSKIATRLLTGFGGLLVFLLLISAISIYRLHQADQFTRFVLNDKLENERKLTEWRNIVEINAARTLAAGKTADAATQKLFEDAIERSSSRAVALLDELKVRIADPQARQLLLATETQRSAYRQARAAAFKQKADGDMEAAQRYFDSEFTVRADAYVASVTQLVVYQRALIDQLRTEIEKSASASIKLIVALAIGAIAAGSALA
ncbi:MAG TPA: MCP four helix bundle domain-containing protein, partial [Burkholderiaceae bacterium]